MIVSIKATRGKFRGFSPAVQPTSVARRGCRAPTKCTKCAGKADKKKCKINKTNCNRNARSMTKCKKQCKKDKKKKKLCQKTCCELGFAV